MTVLIERTATMYNHAAVQLIYGNNRAQQTGILLTECDCNDMYINILHTL